MFVSIDLCLVPIGVGTSLSPYIKECIEVIKSEGLTYQLGANGTAIEEIGMRYLNVLESAMKKFIQKVLLEFIQR